MRWCLNRFALVHFLENAPWRLRPKIVISNASKLNEYSLIESYWEIIDAPTITHLSLKLNTVQNAHLKSKVNTIRIQKLIKNIKNKNNIVLH